MIAGTMLAVIVRGREMGFAALESVECFYKSPDGRLGLYAKPMTALMYKAGAKLEHLTDTDEMHELKGTRKDGNSYTSKFGQEDVKKAGLGNVHKAYPRRMLKWRCLSDMFNTLFPDLTGNSAPIYTAEELMEEVAEGLVDTRNGNVPSGEEQNPFKVTDASKVGQPEPKKAEPPKTEAPKAEPAKAETAKAQPEAKQEPEPEKQRGRRKQQEPKDSTLPPSDPVLDAKIAAEKPSDYVATEDDVPEIIGQKPEGTLLRPMLIHKEEIPQLTRILGVANALSSHAKVSEDQGRLMLKTFFQGFTGKGSFGKPPNDAYTDMLPLAESLIRCGLIDDLIANPKPMGIKAQVGWKSLIHSISAWPEDMQRLAKQVATVQYPDHASDLITYANVAGLKEPNREMWTFLQVCRISKAMPMRLSKAAQNAGVSMESIVAELPENAKEEDILMAIEGAKKPETTDTLFG